MRKNILGKHYREPLQLAFPTSISYTLERTTTNAPNHDPNHASNRDSGHGVTCKSIALGPSVYAILPRTPKLLL
jgi:hypothetical protein